MKRFPLVLGLIGAALIYGSAFAASTLPATACPTGADFACGAAEVRPMSDPTSPGAPGSFVGYISFDGSGVPTFYKTANLNGTITRFPAVVGTCTDGTTTALGILDFTPTGPKFSFVRDNGGDELRLLTTADTGNITPSAVSLATCTHR